MPTSFYKFECDSATTAQRWVKSSKLPPSLLTREGSEWSLADNYAETCKKIRTHDGLVLATLRGDDAHIFALGRVTRLGTTDGLQVIEWQLTPNYVVRPRKGVGLSNWREKSAHEISAGPAINYGLNERLLAFKQALTPPLSAFLGRLKALGYPKDCRVEDDAELLEFLLSLSADGFDVYPSGRRGRRHAAREAIIRQSEVTPDIEETEMSQDAGTICISWKNAYLACIPSNHPVGRACVLHFSDSHAGSFRQAFPHSGTSAELDAFASARGIDPETLALSPAKTQSPSTPRYLHILDTVTASTLIRQNAAIFDPIGYGEAQRGREVYRAADEEALIVKRNQGKLSEAQFKRLVDARRGQGAYREALMKKFDRKCAVSGLGLTGALRASHVLAWHKCDENQQTDPNNGLLLSANLDALFDRYLITFNKAGGLRSSIQLEDHRDHPWPLDGLQAEPTEAQWAYLRLHNKEFEVRENAYLNRIGHLRTPSPPDPICT